MFGLRVKFRTAQYINRLIKIGEYVRYKSIYTAGDVTRKGILKRTAAGVDANLQRFPNWSDYNDSKKRSVYSPQQAARRKRAGKTTSKKNLKITNVLLASLHMSKGEILTVEGMSERIAHGQMYHRKWKYHHLFLMANEQQDVPAIETKVSTDIHRIAGNESV
jgi:hypothetical protein